MTTVRSLLDRLAAGEMDLAEVERQFLDLQWNSEPRQDPTAEEPWLALYRELGAAPSAGDLFSEVADAHVGGRLTTAQYEVLAKAAAAAMRAKMLRTTTVRYVFDGGPKDGETEIFRGTLVGNLYYDDRFGEGMSRYEAVPRTVTTPEGEAYVLEYRGPYNF